MEDSMDMRPKGLVRGYLNVFKKSKNTSKSSKLKKLRIVEVGHFSKIAKSQLSPKLQNLPNGPILFHLFWGWNYCPHALALAMCPYHIFINYFDFDLN